jgi:hypothetical protein
MHSPSNKSCHFSPGNPDNGHLIAVHTERALDRRLAHGEAIPEAEVFDAVDNDCNG